MIDAGARRFTSPRVANKITNLVAELVDETVSDLSAGIHG